MLCPICNGLEQLSAQCRTCSRTLDDCGRMSDYAAPYAPYQPLADDPSCCMETMTFNLRCRHVVYCAGCNDIDEVAVPMWDSPEVLNQSDIKL